MFMMVGRTLPNSPHVVERAAAAEDIELAAHLRVVIAKLYRRLRPTRAATGAGLTPTGISVLLKVDRIGPVRLAAVASEEGINPTMLSRVVADLADAGLLVRRSDEGDRRSAWLEATPAGSKLANRMRRERTAAVNAALAGLSEEQRRRIEKALPALEALAEQLHDMRR
jgi:DNA-binding MarR family transcriptional regulator